MRHESRALSQALDSSEGLGKDEDLQCLQELGNLLFSALDSEADHASEASHLLPCQLVVLVVLQARVNSALHVLVFVEEMGNMIGVLCRFDDSQLQGLDASQGKVAVEWTGVGAETVGGEVDLAVKVLVLEDGCTHDEVRMSSDVLGQAMIGDVCAQEKRRSEIRSGEGVINHNDDARVDLLDCLCHCLNVDQLKGRVGRSLNPNHLCLRLNSLHDILSIGDVNKLSIEAVVLIGEPSHVALSASVDIIADDHMVSLLQGVKDGCSCSAPTCEGDRIGSVLDSSQTVLKGLSGWVTATRVVELTVRLGNISLGIGGSEMDGSVNGAVDRFWLLSSMDGKSGESGMPERKVVGFREGLVVDFGLVLLVNHGY